MLADKFREDAKRLEGQTEMVVPIGRYQATLTNVEDDEEWNVSRFRFSLQNNPGMVFSGGQAVDGATVEKALWWPKDEDRNEMTKGGRQSKFDFKLIQNIKFLEKLGLTLSEGVDYGQTIGLPGVVEIIHYKGREQVKDFDPQGPTTRLDLGGIPA